MVLLGLEDLVIDVSSDCSPDPARVSRIRSKADSSHYTVPTTKRGDGEGSGQALFSTLDGLRRA